MGRSVPRGFWETRSVRYDESMWPIFGLRVTTPRLELRPVDPELAFDVLALAAKGIHDPSWMPFTMPWTDAEPVAMAQGGLQFIWRCWAEWSVTSWRLPWAVVVDGELVGIQDVNAVDFVARRTVVTGSWLGLAHQGRGIGKEMRAAVLHFAFDGLGALRAETSAFTDNEPSLGVTRAMGYEADGTQVGMRRDERAVQVRFKLDRADWEARRRDDIVISGLTPGARAQFGLDADGRPPA
jgi:RimJ/RimL family protein N-acetyltransferase